MQIQPPVTAVEPGAVVPGPGSDRGDDLRTRDRVARTVLEHGPLTASDLACRVGLTAAAVRRHLDALVDTGLAVVREPVRDASRGRGRPARAYVLTSAGHDSMSGPMDAAYDDLAASALSFMAEQLGPEAIEAFAERRVADLERRYAPVVAAAGDDVGARTRALAGALADDGYAASTRSLGASAQAGAGSRDVGTQLCQGHCPVQHVAARFPQLCEAETEVFSRLLGVHVQRLATLAGGAHVCTTHVPAARAPTSSSRTSTDRASTQTSTDQTLTTSTTRTSDGRTR